MKCPDCGSTTIVRIGLVVTRLGKKQRYRCNKCGRTFYYRPACNSACADIRSRRH